MKAVFTNHSDKTIALNVYVIQGEETYAFPDDAFGPTWRIFLPHATKEFDMPLNPDSRLVVTSSVPDVVSYEIA